MVSLKLEIASADSEKELPKRISPQFVDKLIELGQIINCKIVDATVFVEENKK